MLVGLPAKEVFQVASVRYITGLSHGNPVIYYRQRRGTSIEQPVNFDSAIPLSAKTEPHQRPQASDEGYASVLGDYNPIHVSLTCSSYTNLAGTITHEMFSSAEVRSLVQTWAAQNRIAGVRSFFV